MRWRGSGAAVQDHDAVAHLDRVAGQADHALDKILVGLPG